MGDVRNYVLDHMEGMMFDFIQQCGAKSNEMHLKVVQRAYGVQRGPSTSNQQPAHERVKHGWHKMRETGRGMYQDKL